MRRVVCLGASAGFRVGLKSAKARSAPALVPQRGRMWDEPQPMLACGGQTQDSWGCPFCFGGKPRDSSTV